MQKSFGDRFGSAFGAIFLRFPAVTLSAVSAAIIACWLISQEAENHPHFSFFAKLLSLLLLAIPLFFSLSIFFEQNQRYRRAYIPGFLAAIALLTGYYFSLPERMDAFPFYQGFRYLAFALAFHAITAFSAFYRFADIQAFWQFNSRIFLRFLQGAFYCLVLFGGIALSFVALDYLLDIQVPDRSYAWLAILLGLVFHPFFFLYGIPEELHILRAAQAYPRALNIFTRFVLLPLVLLYLLILYAYGFKILATWALPKGFVSLMVLFFAVFGILAYLLVYPLRNEAEQKWIKRFIHSFFIALLPLLLMLGVAIWKRINTYGWTEERYTVVALAIWLTFIALYFLISRRDNIILIPLSLAVVAILSVLGPWNMFRVSRQDQFDRLTTYLQAYKLYQDGRIVPAADSVAGILPDSTYDELYSISAYLGEHHGWEILESRMDTGRRASIHDTVPLTNTYQWLRYLHVSRSNGNTKYQYGLHSIAATPDRPYSIAGYRQMSAFYAPRVKDFGDTALQMRVWGDTVYTRSGLRFELGDSLRAWRDQTGPESFETIGGGMRVPEHEGKGLLLLEQVSFGQKNSLESCQGYILLQ